MTAEKTTGEDVTRLAVARDGELLPGNTKKFAFRVAGVEIEAFLLNYKGELHAYVNRCRHVAMGLDWVDNEFFSEDGLHVVCATHGACYAPESGQCVSGPPLGKALVRVPLETENGVVFASLPETEIAAARARQA